MLSEILSISTSRTQKHQRDVWLAALAFVVATITTVYLLRSVTAAGLPLIALAYSVPTSTNSAHLPESKFGEKSCIVFKFNALPMYMAMCTLVAMFHGHLSFSDILVYFVSLRTGAEQTKCESELSTSEAAPDYLLDYEGMTSLLQVQDHILQDNLSQRVPRFNSMRRSLSCSDMVSRDFGPALTVSNLQYNWQELKYSESGPELPTGRVRRFTSPSKVYCSKQGSLSYVDRPSYQSSEKRFIKTEIQTRSMPQVVEIMCVAHEAVDNRILESVLYNEGYVVSKCRSVDGLLELLERRHCASKSFPALVIMDLFQSQVRGNAAVQQLRRLYPLAPLPIIFLSACKDKESIKAALKAGANDYITKPFEQENLLARIRVQLHTMDFWEAKIRLQQDSELLKDILPSPIIHRIQNGQNNVAEKFEHVTVLFSDIVGFDDVARKVPTPDVISMLDGLFNGFDILADKHAVFKVETIGDTYMAVAGLGKASNERHAEQALKMANAMLSLSSRVLSGYDSTLSLRIGAHSGPVYAGVIGEKRRKFCLFGDTVNVASKMLTSGCTGGIHVSTQLKEAYLLLPEAGLEAFQFLDRGLQNIKWKGDMHTWLVKSS
uniref:Two-component system, OmpR family, response regulator RpaA n=1 Tax=Tetraselmis sp. GSL018 TaxID=582737 RepID=A0A061RE77_9CHLO